MKLLKQYWIGILAALLMGVAAWMISVKLHPKTLPTNLVEGVGRIDGDLVRLNAKYPGRVIRLTVHDGDAVHRGELIASLESREQQARRERIVAEARAKAKELAAKRTEFAIAKETIPLALQRAEAQLKNRRAQMEELQRNIEALQKVVAQDRRDYERSSNLYASKLIQKEALEKAKLQYSTDRDRLAGLLAKQKQLEAVLKAAEADWKEAKAQQKKIEALKQEIEALKEALAAAKAGIAQIDAVLADMNLTSPLDGFVVEKVSQEGEVIGVGMPVATLIDPDSLYLKIYVDTIENGKIKVGDEAVIFLDARPDRPIPAKVVRIAQKAEFTPKEVNVRADRIQRVYAVHLKPLEPNPLLKLGLPAIGVISLDGKGIPKSLEEIPEI